MSRLAATPSSGPRARGPRLAAGPPRLGDVRLLCFLFACVLGARTAGVLCDDPAGPPRLPVRPVRIDVNRAPAAALAALPGVGPTLARRIVAERRNWAFLDADDMTRVSGIGPVAVSRVAPHVRFGPAPGGR